MAYGFATHLWIAGLLDPVTIRRVLDSERLAPHADHLHAFTTRGHTVLCVPNTSDAGIRSTAHELLSALRDADWEGRSVWVDVQPDHDFWQVDHHGSEVQGGGTSLARSVLEQLTGEALAEVHHYVDWAHSVEAALEGRTDASPFRPDVAALDLGLPHPPPSVSDPPAASSGAHPDEAWSPVARTALALVVGAASLVAAVVGILAAVRALLLS